MFDVTFDFNPSEEKRGYNITIFTDDPDSWILPWTRLIKNILQPFHNVLLCFNKEEIQSSNFAFLLGCTKMLPLEFLLKNELNIVVHESDLPVGRGWSPLSWQVLEGKNRIPIVLFEAREAIDSGPVYLRDVIELDGTELLPEIKKKQGTKTIELVCKFLEQWPELKPAEQIGTPTYYPKRTTQHDMIDVNKTTAQNFDHLRVVDNEKHPAWFEYRGRKYKIKIYPYE